MPVFTPKGREFYTHEGLVGVGKQKGLSDADWNLNALVNRRMYAYELDLGPARTPGYVSEELTTAIKNSMRHMVNGRAVAEWMGDDSPERFLEACISSEGSAIERLPVCVWAGGVSNFMIVLIGRTATWKKANRMFLNPQDRHAIEQISANC